MAAASKKGIDKTKTIVIDNFTGNMTRVINGDLNSGNAKYTQTFGVDNYAQPKNLTFMENAISIGGAVVTGCVMAMKTRVENSIMYVYAIDHLARLYKIQVNNPLTNNPVYDNPVLLATLVVNSPTFLYGASLEFYSPAGTEFIYIAHDTGLNQINFNGTGELQVAYMGGWIGNVPHNSRQFLGKVFYSNGPNVAVLDSTNTITSYAVLNPGLPANFQVRTVDLTQDGVYLVIVATRANQYSILSPSPDINSTIATESMIVYWNGTTAAATSSSSIPSFVMSAYKTFANFEYSFGYDLTGAIVMNPLQKILTCILARSPLPNAVTANGNIIGWMVPEFVNGFMNATLFLYGQLDAENPIIFTRQYRMVSSLSGGDIINIPSVCITSNFELLGATSGYAGGLVSLGKLYFSTIEYNGVTTAYKLYSFTNVPVGLGTATSGVYETQTQLFSHKIKSTEIRVYTEPLVTNNAFKIDLIGSNGNPISNASNTFTVGTGATATGLDMLQYNPTMGGTYALGVRITNIGSVNSIIHKIEVDYQPFGK